MHGRKGRRRKDDEDENDCRRVEENCEERRTNKGMWVERKRRARDKEREKVKVTEKRRTR